MFSPRQAKAIYGGWLLLAPEGTNFDNPLHRSRVSPFTLDAGSICLFCECTDFDIRLSIYDKWCYFKSMWPSCRMLMPKGKMATMQMKS